MLSIFRKIFTPVQVLTFGFALLILTGTILLMLPVSSSSHTSQSFIDALFTSTSAVSTTGLIVVDTPTYYSLFGQIVIITLIQIGGLGYMVFFVMSFLIVKESLSITGKKYLRESVARLPKVDMIKFSKLTILYTFLIEVTGTVLYFIVWIKHFPFGESLYLSLFHSVSAFCTAGFSLFTDSLSTYKYDFLINLNSNFLVITGAIGFFVLYDVFNYIKSKIKKDNLARLTVHSKIVLTTTAILLITGSVLVYFFEGTKYSSSPLERIYASSFQAISASTTVGFNSIDIGILSNASLFVLIILMFIGASPGSTGGGIKTTSFAVLIKSVLSTIRGRNFTSYFKRKVSSDAISKSSAQIMVALFSVGALTLVMTVTEKYDFIRVLFEAVSAFGTVGLSTGITPQLTVIGKTAVIILMFIGRVGPLAIGLSLFQKPSPNNYSYPEEEILIS